MKKPAPPSKRSPIVQFLKDLGLLFSESSFTLGVLFVIGVIWVGVSIAQPIDSPAQVLATLRRLQPATQFDKVAASQLPGLFEVSMGRNLAYVDASGRYWLFGHVWDMQTQTDLTQGRMADLDRVDFGQLPTDQAIRFVNGKPLRTLAVFADPNCGYCKVLEKELPQLKDTQIYVFPIGILSQDSIAKAQAIWCSPDRATAWRAWMTKATVPAAPSAACMASAPTERLNELAKSLRVDGTPTFIAADGRKRAGARSVAEIAAWLNSPADRDGQAVALPSAQE